MILLNFSQIKMLIRFGFLLLSSQASVGERMHYSNTDKIAGGVYMSVGKSYYHIMSVAV